MSNPVPKIIGICGGSASGKTTLAKHISDILGSDQTIILSMDSFYIDFIKQGRDPEEVNFDHPESFDLSLMFRVLSELQEGRGVEVPVYDFKTHTRLLKKNMVSSAPFIILEGLFLFNVESLNTFFTYRIYIDTPSDIRLKRRIQRDSQERGRTPDSVRRQFAETVSPMHDEFVRPNRLLADLVIQGHQDFEGQLTGFQQILDS